MKLTSETKVADPALAEPVTLDQVRAALSALGIELPVDRIRSVFMDVDGIKVEYLPEGAAGGCHVLWAPINNGVGIWSPAGKRGRRG